MRYIFPFIILLLIVFIGCEKSGENQSDTTWQSEYESSACSSNSENETRTATEILTDTEDGFGEIYIID